MIILFISSKETFSSFVDYQFVENAGQWPEDIKYMAKTKGMNVWITKNGFILDKFLISKNVDTISGQYFHKYDRDYSQSYERTGHVITVSFHNSNKFNRYKGDAKIQRKFKYLPPQGNQKIITASAFLEITYSSVYDGIDVVYQIDDGNFRFDFKVKPDSDPNLILMSIEGHNSIKMSSDGSINIGTTLNDIKFGKILAFQEINGTKSVKECEYSILGTSMIQLSIDNYDKNLELNIDPTVYATYFGGEGNDECHNIICDLDKNIYLNTQTSSLYIPRGIGKYTISNDSLDTDLSKLSPCGKNVIYTLFLYRSKIKQILIDKQNELILMGATSDTSFPTTKDAYHRELIYDDSSNRYLRDYYLIKLDSSSENILISTFLNVSGGQPTCIKQDHNEDFYIGGISFSEKFYITDKSIKKVQDTNEYSPFNFDGFISKISSDGSEKVFSSKFGGTREERVFDLDIDSLGYIYVTGFTNSNDFDLTNDAIQRIGGQDTINYHYTGFISKLLPDGSDFVYSSYFGGEEQTAPTTLILDDNNIATIIGVTSSKNFPRGNNYNTIFNEIDKDYDSDRIFLVKFDFSEIKIPFSALLGDRNSHTAWNIIGHKDSMNYYYVMIGKPSSIISSTDDAYQKEPRAMQLIKVDPELSKILYSTYLGGDGHYHDMAEDMWVSPGGTVYVCGATPANNFPTTPDALRTYYSGEFDGYFAIFRDLGIVSVEHIVNDDNHISIGNLFPNPAVKKINIEINLNNTINPENINFKIYDVLGAEYPVGGIEVVSQSSYYATISIPVEGMPSGTYILSAMQKDFNVSKIFVRY